MCCAIFLFSATNGLKIQQGEQGNRGEEEEEGEEESKDLVTLPDCYSFQTCERP